MKYYHDHAAEYIESTIHADMSAAYDMVEKYLKPNASVLDVGFGSARDMLYFSRRGYDVEGIDIEEEFVNHAEMLNLKAYLADALSFKSEKKYDLIWCCASLLHLPREKLAPTIRHLCSLLKNDGILFLSMKYSSREDGYDEKERYFTYIHEKDVTSFPSRIVERKITSDFTRDDVKWINMIIRNPQMKYDADKAANSCI